jgi:hypothetical protein
MPNNGSLINRRACKELALRWAQANRRGWMPSQVSRQFLDDLDTKVRLLIQGSVERHRTVGKTVKDLF